MGCRDNGFSATGRGYGRSDRVLLAPLPYPALSLADARRRAHVGHLNSYQDIKRRIAMLLVLINVLIIVVVGALLFWIIDRFVRDGRLANLLKILVVLICLAAILQRVLPLFGVSGLL